LANPKNFAKASMRFRFDARLREDVSIFGAFFGKMNETPSRQSMREGLPPAAEMFPDARKML
jgi:hypothetical protein